MITREILPLSNICYEPEAIAYASSNIRIGTMLCEHIVHRSSRGSI